MIAGIARKVTVHGQPTKAPCIVLSGAAKPGQHCRPRLFGALGNAVITGPTLTNINDFGAVLSEAPGA